MYQVHKLFAQFEVIEGLIPEIEIFDGGKDTSVTHMIQGGVEDLEPIFGFGVAVGSLFNDFRVVIVVVGVFHAQRLEDLFLGKRVERFAADTGDDDTQQEVSGIGIEMFVARNEVQTILSCYHGYRFFRCVEIITGFPRQIGQSEIVADTACMMDQMPDGDGFFIHREFRYIFSDIVIERQLSLEKKNGDTGRRKLLGRGTDTEYSLRCVWHIMLQIGHAVAPFVDELSVVDNAHRCARRYR